ncbi:hypothetical protein [Breoghania sp.]|uniref:hypothetical protein n=1 Tax=Breoghania sp. TaxID=2065378 RepID=UPI002624A353|nr:hypothetical protein [Breoghania sp.]
MPEMSETSSPADAPRTRRLGLSAKLLILKVSFVMMSKVLIFVPLVANFRNSWVSDKLRTAGVAAAVLAESDVISPSLQTRLLQATGSSAIALNDGPTRRLVAMSTMPPMVDEVVDMSTMDTSTAILQAFDTLVNGAGRTIRIIGKAEMGMSGTVEIVMPEAPLRNAMLGFAGRILELSLMISIITTSLVYVALRWLFVRPL